VADEKHTWWWGERIYVAVTAAMGCFLGVAIAESADAAALTDEVAPKNWTGRKALAPKHDRGGL